MPASSSAKSKSKTRLHFQIVKAKGLPLTTAEEGAKAKVDPFCVVYLDGKQVGLTATLRATSSPAWVEETFTLSLPMDVSKSILRVDVFDDEAAEDVTHSEKSRVRTFDESEHSVVNFLGSLFIRGADLLAVAPRTSLLPLGPNPDRDDAYNRWVKAADDPEPAMLGVKGFVFGLKKSARRGLRKKRPRKAADAKPGLEKVVEEAPATEDPATGDKAATFGLCVKAAKDLSAVRRAAGEKCNAFATVFVGFGEEGEDVGHFKIGSTPKVGQDAVGSTRWSWNHHFDPLPMPTEARIEIWDDVPHHDPIFLGQVVLSKKQIANMCAPRQIGEVADFALGLRTADQLIAMHLTPDPKAEAHVGGTLVLHAYNKTTLDAERSAAEETLRAKHDAAMAKKEQELREALKRADEAEAAGRGDAEAEAARVRKQLEEEQTRFNTQLEETQEALQKHRDEAEARAASEEKARKDFEKAMLTQRRAHQAVMEEHMAVMEVHRNQLEEARKEHEDTLKKKQAEAKMQQMLRTQTQVALQSNLVKKMDERHAIDKEKALLDAAAQHEERLVRLQAEARDEMARVQADKEAALQDAAAQHDLKTAGLQAQLKTAEQQVRLKEEQHGDMQAKYDAEISRQREQHKAEVMRLKREHDEKLARATAEAAEVERNAKMSMLRAHDESTRAQQALTAMQKTHDDTVMAIQDAASVEVEERLVAAARNQSVKMDEAKEALVKAEEKTKAKEQQLLKLQQQNSIALAKIEEDSVKRTKASDVRASQVEEHTRQRFLASARSLKHKNAKLKAEAEKYKADLDKAAAEARTMVVEAELDAAKKEAMVRTKTVGRITIAKDALRAAHESESSSPNQKIKAITAQPLSRINGTVLAMELRAAMDATRKAKRDAAMAEQNLFQDTMRRQDKDGLRRRKRKSAPKRSIMLSGPETSSAPASVKEDPYEDISTKEDVEEENDALRRELQTMKESMERLVRNQKEQEEENTGLPWKQDTREDDAPVDRMPSLVDTKRKQSRAKLPMGGLRASGGRASGTKRVQFTGRVTETQPASSSWLPDKRPPNVARVRRQGLDDSLPDVNSGGRKPPGGNARRPHRRRTRSNSKGFVTKSIESVHSALGIEKSRRRQRKHVRLQPKNATANAKRALDPKRIGGTMGAAHKITEVKVTDLQEIANSRAFSKVDKKVLTVQARRQAMAKQRAKKQGRIEDEMAALENYRQLQRSLSLSFAPTRSPMFAPTWWTTDPISGAKSDNRRERDMVRQLCPAPVATPEVDFVHGYNSACKATNIWLLPSGELVFPCGALVAIMDRRTRKMRFFNEHAHFVTCVAVNLAPAPVPFPGDPVARYSNIIVAASGAQACGNPAFARLRKKSGSSSKSSSLRGAVASSSNADQFVPVCVWSTGIAPQPRRNAAGKLVVGSPRGGRRGGKSGQARLLFNLKHHTCSIAATAFSSDGQLLVSVGVDGAMAVWAWRNRQLLVSTLDHANGGTIGSLWAISFDPIHCHSEEDDRGMDPRDSAYALVTSGQKHVKFWSLAYWDDVEHSETTGASKSSKALKDLRKSSGLTATSALGKGGWVLDSGSGNQRKSRHARRPAGYQDIACHCFIGRHIAQLPDSVGSNKKTAIFTGGSRNKDPLKGSVSAVVTGTGGGDLYVWHQFKAAPHAPLLGSEAGDNEFSETPPPSWTTASALIASALNAHPGGVTAIASWPLDLVAMTEAEGKQQPETDQALHPSFCVVSCGKDGRLKQWHLLVDLTKKASDGTVRPRVSLEMVRNIDLSAAIAALEPGETTSHATSICLDRPVTNKDAGQSLFGVGPDTHTHVASAGGIGAAGSFEASLVVGTSRNVIVAVHLPAQINEDGSSEVQVARIVGGHCIALRGRADKDAKSSAAVATHPTEPIYATTGGDLALRVWHATKHILLAVAPLAAQGMCVAFHPDGGEILVGTADAAFVSFKVPPEEVLLRASPAGRWDTACTGLYQNCSTSIFSRGDSTDFTVAAAAAVAADALDDALDGVVDASVQKSKGEAEFVIFNCGSVGDGECTFSFGGSHSEDLSTIKHNPARKYVLKKFESKRVSAKVGSLFIGTTVGPDAPPNGVVLVCPVEAGHNNHWLRSVHVPFKGSGHEDISTKVLPAPQAAVDALKALTGRGGGGGAGAGRGGGGGGGGGDEVDVEGGKNAVLGAIHHASEPAPEAAAKKKKKPAAKPKQAAAAEPPATFTRQESMKRERAATKMQGVHRKRAAKAELQRRKKADQYGARKRTRHKLKMEKLKAEREAAAMKLQKVRRQRKAKEELARRRAAAETGRIYRAKEGKQVNIMSDSSTVANAWFGNPGKEWDTSPGVGLTVTNIVKKLLIHSNAVTASVDNFSDPCPELPGGKILLVEIRSLLRSKTRMSLHPENMTTKSLKANKLLESLEEGGLAGDGSVSGGGKKKKVRQKRRSGRNKPKPRCISFSPNGQFVAVSCRSKLIVFEKIKLSEVHRARAGTAQEFSYTRVSGARGGSSYIVQLDWSDDGRFIKTNDLGKNIRFFEFIVEPAVEPFTARGRKRLVESNDAMALRDVAWQTRTCVHGWDVHGVWPDQQERLGLKFLQQPKSGKKSQGNKRGMVSSFSERASMAQQQMAQSSSGGGSSSSSSSSSKAGGPYGPAAVKIKRAQVEAASVSTACHSHDGKYVLSADTDTWDGAKLRLFRSPCIAGALCKDVVGPAARVSACRFGAKDAFAVAVGGADQGVFQLRTTNTIADETFAFMLHSFVGRGK